MTSLFHYLKLSTICCAMFALAGCATLSGLSNLGALCGSNPQCAVSGLPQIINPSATPYQIDIIQICDASTQTKTLTTKQRTALAALCNAPPTATPTSQAAETMSAALRAMIGG